MLVPPMETLVKRDYQTIEKEAAELTKRFYNVSYVYLQKDNANHSNDRELAIQMSAVMMSHYHDLTR